MDGMLKIGLVLSFSPVKSVIDVGPPLLRTKTAVLTTVLRR
jgi:hypothetical protein